MHIYTGRQKLKKMLHIFFRDSKNIFLFESVELSLPADDFIIDSGSYEGLNIYTYHNFVKQNVTCKSDEKISVC